MRKRGRTHIKLNGLPVHRVGETIFIPLPRELWRETGWGQCVCKECKANKAQKSYWDTLAISATPVKKDSDTVWTVHYPSLQKGRK